MGSPVTVRAVEYTPSSPNGNWTSLCQIAAQARSVGYAADRPNSEAGSDSTIPNFAYLRDLWDGKVDVPDIGALYNNNQTTYATDFMNNPASYMAGTKYFDAASQWYPSLQQNGGSGATADFLTDYFFSAMRTKVLWTGPLRCPGRKRSLPTSRSWRSHRHTSWLPRTPCTTSSSLRRQLQRTTRLVPRTTSTVLRLCTSAVRHEPCAPSCLHSGQRRHHCASGAHSDS